MAKADEFVKALRTSSHVGSVQDARARDRDQWLKDLELLRGTVREWLSPVIEANLADVHDRDFELNEPDFGEYPAPGLEVKLNVAGEVRTLLLRPRGGRVAGVVAPVGGKRIVGASGRVDIECGVERAILLRFRNDAEPYWVSFPQGEWRNLTEDVFFELLATVAGVELR